MLEELLRGWLGPQDRVGGGVVEGENCLAHPAILQWWSSVSKWNRQLVTLNRAVPLSDLSTERGMVTFWIEDQGDVVWGYDSQRDDSCVYFDLGDGWHSTGLDVSGFLFRMSLVELVASTQFTAERRGAEVGVVTRVAAGLKGLDIGTIGWLPRNSKLMYSGDRIVEAIPAFGDPALFDITVAFRDDAYRREWMAGVGEAIGFRNCEPQDGAVLMEAPPF